MQTNMNNDFFVVVPKEVDDTSIVEFELNSPLILSENHQCALYDINLPPIRKKSIRTLVKIVYFADTALNHQNGPFNYNFDDHVYKQFYYQADIGDYYEFTKKFCEYCTEQSPTESELKADLKFFMDNYPGRIMSLQRFYQLKINFFPSSGKGPFSIRIMQQMGTIDFKCINPIHVTPIKQDLTLNFYYKFDNEICNLYALPKFYNTTEYKFHHNKLVHPGYDKKLQHDNPFSPERSNVDVDELFKIITATYHDIYVLSNIVTYSLVNNQHRRIMRWCHFDANGRLRVPLDKLLYLELKCHEIKKIIFEFLDDNFEPVRFEKGQALITIHFAEK